MPRNSLRSSITLPIAFAAAVLAPATMAKNPDSAHGGMKLSATLSGANEVNEAGVRDQGDPDGTGSFSGRLNHGQGQVCYTLASANIEPPSAAHIHVGAAGKNGDVVVPLDITPGEHCATVTKELADQLMKNPGGYYVNVHNAKYPAGAARGQLTK